MQEWISELVHRTIDQLALDRDSLYLHGRRLLLSPANATALSNMVRELRRSRILELVKATGSRNSMDIQTALAALQVDQNDCTPDQQLINAGATALLMLIVDQIPFPNSD